MIFNTAKKVSGKWWTADFIDKRTLSELKSFVIYAEGE